MNIATGRCFKVWCLGIGLLLVALATPRVYAVSPRVRHASSAVMKAPAASLENGNTSLRFIENMGQFDDAVRFQAQIPQGTLFVTDDALWLSVVEIPSLEACRLAETALSDKRQDCLKRGVNLRLSFVNSNSQPRIEAFTRHTSGLSYFVGNDPEQWKTNIPQWRGIRFIDLYPGLDLVLTYQDGKPTFHWIVQDAGRTPLDAIQLRVEGAEAVTTHRNSLLLDTAVGQITFPLFQVVKPDGQPVTNLPISYIRDHKVVAPFVRTSATPQPASTSGTVLLPSNLLSSTFLGGSHYDYGYDIVRDNAGNIYVFGETISVDFPTTPGAWQTTSPNAPPYRNLFISKFSPDLSQLLISTYLGGTGDEYAEKIALDDLGNVYLAGYHRSDSTFPTTETTWPVDFGGSTAYVVKMPNQLNALIYVAFLGGSGVEIAYGIAVDDIGAVYVTGQTESPNFLITNNAYDTIFNSPPKPSNYADGFVTKIKPDGTGVEYSTFLGGNDGDVLYGIDIDREGHAYVVGRAGSDDYPITAGVFDTTTSIPPEGVITKLAADGGSLVYSSFLGGQGGESASAVVVDAAGYAYVTGQTFSVDFPVTAGAYQTTCGSGCGSTGDGFLTKITPTASALVYSTFFGGNGKDLGIDLTVDADHNVFVVGTILSTDFAATPGAFSADNSTEDTFDTMALLKFGATGSDLLHATYLKANGTGIVLADPDTVFVTGWTKLPDFPTTPNAYDRTCGVDGQCDGVDLPGDDSDITYTDAILTHMALPPAALTVTLGVEGGTLASGADQIAYTFPANTFTDTVVFTHAPRHPLSMPPVVALAHVNRAFANYAVLSDTATLVSPTQPYSLSVTYDEGDLTTDEATLALYYWDGATWVVEPTGVLDTATNTLTAQPDRVGWWAVLGEARRLFLPLVVRK